MPLRLPAPVLLALIGLVVAGLAALGVWQLQRNEWRNELVDARRERLEAPPQSLEELVALPPEETDYRRVEVTGRWDHEHTMLLANRVRFATKGEEVVTPLLPDGGGPAVLVNRGWYPEAERANVLAALRREETATVTGLARYIEDPRTRHVEGNTWTRVDPDAMAEALPYPLQPWTLVQGELVDSITRTPTLPVQQYTAYESPVPHLQYAITWFGLAGLLVAVAVARFVIAPRRSGDETTPERPLAAPPPEGSRPGR